MNREIIRARKIIAELKLNNNKAHQLTHTLRNLLTVQRLIREQIHRPATCRLLTDASIPKITTWRITKELRNLTIEREKMKKESEVKLACYLSPTRQTIQAVRKMPPKNASRPEGQVNLTPQFLVIALNIHGSLSLPYSASRPISALTSGSWVYQLNVLVRR